MATKQKKIIITLVSVIILLSIVSIASVTYNFLGGFYRSRVIKYDKVLGETQTIEINNVGAFSTACNFSGLTLLNDDISQKIYIKTTNVVDAINLRAKVYVVGYENKNCEMFGYTNWVAQDNDKYIYFNQKVGSNEQIGLCKYIRLSSDINLESNVDYILVFTVEAY